MLSSKGLRNENRGPGEIFPARPEPTWTVASGKRQRSWAIPWKPQERVVVFQPRWFGKISQDIPWEIGNRLREGVLFFWDPSNPSFWRIHHSNHAKSCAFTSQQYLEQILHHHNGGSFLERFLKSYLAQVIFYCLFQGFTVAGMARVRASTQVMTDVWSLASWGVSKSITFFGSIILGFPHIS